MKMLILCLLGVVLTSAGTLALEGTMKSVSQWSFMVVAAVSVFLLVTGYFK